MGKRKSEHIAGLAHALTFSTYQRERVFCYAPCAREFVAVLGEAVREKQWQLLAYMVMPDHVHLLLVPGDSDSIAMVLKRVKMPASFRIWPHLASLDPPMASRLQTVNVRGQIENRIWQRGGGYDQYVTSHEAYREIVNSIHANPVREGLVQELEDWEFSSVHAYLGKVSPCPVTRWDGE